MQLYTVTYHGLGIWYINTQTQATECADLNDEHSQYSFTFAMLQSTKQRIVARVFYIRHDTGEAEAHLSNCASGEE